MKRMKTLFLIVCSAILLAGPGPVKMDGTWKAAVSEPDTSKPDWGFIVFELNLQQSGKAFDGNGAVKAALGKFDALQDHPLKVSSGVVLANNDVSFIAESDLGMGKVTILFKGRHFTRDEMQQMLQQEKSTEKLPEGNYDYFRGTATVSLSTILGSESMPCSFRMSNRKN
jgi:hypothetical protein